MSRILPAVVAICLVLFPGCDDDTVSPTTPLAPAYVRFANCGSGSIPVDFEVRRPLRDQHIARPDVSDGEITGYIRVEAGRYEIRQRAAGGEWGEWRERVIGPSTRHTIVGGYLRSTGRPIRFMSGDLLDPPATSDHTSLVRLHHLCPDGPYSHIVREINVPVLYYHFRYPITTSVEHGFYHPEAPFGPFRIVGIHDDAGVHFDSRYAGFEPGRSYTMIIWGWDDREGLRYTIASNDPDVPYEPPPPSPLLP